MLKKSAHKSKAKKSTLSKKRSILQTHHKVGVGVIVVLAIVLASLRFLPFHQTQVSAKSLMATIKRPSRPVCGLPGNGKAHCHAHVITDSAGTPLSTTTPYTGTYGTTQFHIGYNLPCTPSGTTQATCATPSSFGPQTIAIVDAYNDTTVENDLNFYSSYYGIPPCTKANGCLQVVNQTGQTALPTTTDSGWALETSLDVQVAHALCQTCKILLVEANSNSMSDLGTGVNTAATLGATAISNSYGAPEWSGETSYDSYYTHAGVAVTVSAGDNGYATEYPAASRNVVAIGGTSLQLYTDSTYTNETVWSGTGSGCSAYETANSWQTNLSTWAQTGCGTARAIGDVSADADPNTGAAVYDSTPYNGSTGWYQVGGTSLSSPIIASIYALTGGVFTSSNPAALPYAQFTSINSHDVQTGSNGTCSTNMCTATSGYDGPTGLGSPNGLTGFENQVSSTPTPIASTSPTLTPTKVPATPTPTPKPKHPRHTF